MKTVCSVALACILLLLGSCEEEMNPPQSPTLILPQNNDSVDGYTVLFAWEETPLSEKYTFQLSTIPDFTNLEINREGLTTTTITVPDLIPDTDYYWRVNAMNAEGSSGWSAISKFSTKALGAPTLTKPSENTTVSISNVIFEWTEVPDASGYALQISRVNDFSTLEANQENLSSTSYTHPQLLNSTNYFWRVSSTMSNSKSSWSAIGTFNTEPLASPGLVSPIDNLTGSSRSVEFDWTTLAGVESYELQVSTSENFTNQVLEKVGVTESNYSLSELMFSTIYYWRVRAEKGGIKSNWSETRKFTTEALGIPVLQLPVDNTQLTNYSVTLTWNGVEDATSYNLQVSESSDFTTTILNKTSLISNSHPVTLTKSNTQYYWRVNAQMGNCLSEWSDVRNFTTPLIPQDGLVAWYPFNGNANDESGNNNHGTIFGGVTSTTDRYNQVASAFIFNGTSGYIEIPTLNTFQYKPVTYSAWVIVSSYFPSSAGHKFRSIIGRQELGNTVCGMLGFWADKNVANGAYDNTFNYWMGGASQPDIPWSKTIPEINSWVHIAFTQSANGDFKFYMNGELSNSGNLQNAQSANISFRIGSGIGANSYFWNSKIDDVRVYSRVLTGEEIVALYHE